MRRRVWPFGLVAAVFGAVAALVAFHVAVPYWSQHNAAAGETRLHAALLSVLLLVLARGLLRVVT